MIGIGNGASRAFGAESKVTWQGKDYLIKVTVRDFTNAESHYLELLRKRKMQAVGDMYGSVPDEVWERKYNEAKREAERTCEVAPQELAIWLETRDGVAFVLWSALSRQNPGEFKLDQMTELMLDQLTDKEFEELHAKLAQASGTDAAGNSTGQ